MSNPDDERESLDHNLLRRLKPSGGQADPRVAFYEMGYEAARSELSHFVAADQPANQPRPVGADQRGTSATISAWSPSRSATAACVLAIVSLSSFVFGRQSMDQAPARTRSVVRDKVLHTPAGAVQQRDTNDVGSETLLPEIAIVSDRSSLPVSVLDAVGFELTAGGPRSQPSRTFEVRAPSTTPTVLRAADIFNPSQSLLN